MRPRGRGESSRSAGAARGAVPEGAASDTSAAPRLWSPRMRSWGEITAQALPWGQDFTPRRGALLKQQEAPCKRERKSLGWGATMGARGGGSQLGAPMGAGDGHRPRHHVPTNGPPSPGAGCCKQEEAELRCPHRALPAHCWLSTYVAVACWHPSLPRHRAIPGTTRSPVPFRHGTPLATSLRLQHSQLQKAKFPPSGPAGSGSGSVPTSNKSKEPLVSSSVSQYFTELCFPYLVQLKSQGEVLYKSKFF